MTVSGVFTELRYGDWQVGAVGLVWGGSLVSRAIQAGETLAGEGDHPPSHAIVVGDDGIIEAAVPRIRVRPYTEYPIDRVRMFLPDVPLSDRLLAVLWAKKEWVGKDYGYWEILGMASVEMERALGCWPKWNWARETRAKFCSQLAVDVLHKEGVELSAAADVTDPAGLLKLVTS